jgi:hypothetical protein
MGQEKIVPIPDRTTTGIDISKDYLDVHLYPGGSAQQFTNDRKGHTKLIAWTKPNAHHLLGHRCLSPGT